MNLSIWVGRGLKNIYREIFQVVVIYLRALIDKFRKNHVS